MERATQGKKEKQPNLTRAHAAEDLRVRACSGYEYPGVVDRGTISVIVGDIRVNYDIAISGEQRRRRHQWEERY